MAEKVKEAKQLCVIGYQWFVNQNNNTTIKWNPPPLNTLKINFDGSVLGDSAASGFVIRDYNARPLLAATRNAGKTNVPVAEALALRDSLISAKNGGYQRLKVIQSL